jgi:hypothetical protein
MRRRTSTRTGIRMGIRCGVLARRSVRSGRWLARRFGLTGAANATRKGKMNFTSRGVPWHAPIFLCGKSAAPPALGTLLPKKL